MKRCVAEGAPSDALPMGRTVGAAADSGAPGAHPVRPAWEQVPKTAYNFMALAASGYYAGTIFHRNIKGFMLQVRWLSSSLPASPPALLVCVPS